jgi:hypothetical protein
LEKLAKNFEEINNTSEGKVTPNCHPELVEGPQKEKKLRKKKKSVSDSPTPTGINYNQGGISFIEPNLGEIKNYFQENNFPELEAQKFYNYFKSVGWLVGGKIPMADWQAAAQNWMLNTPKFISNEEQPNRAKNLNTTTDKDYSEPL